MTRVSIEGSGLCHGNEMVMNVCCSFCSLQVGGIGLLAGWLGSVSSVWV
jgi:hypothetical protein